MKRLRIIEAFVLLSVATGSWYGAQANAEQDMSFVQTKKHPVISLTKTVHDFGKIVQGEKAVTIFVFRNTGDDVLNIDQVVSDNENITTVVSHKFLQPGRQGSIQVTLDSNELDGDIVSQISVTTNDNERPEVFLKIMAHAQPIIALDPPFIFVGRVAKEGSFSGKVKLVGKLVDEGKLKTFRTNTSSSSIEMRIQRRTVKDKKVVFLEFVLLPEMKAGSFRESITIVSKNPPAKAQLLLFGQKLGGIRVSPDRLDFFPRKGIKSDSRSILFECNERFKITKVEDVSGLFSLSLKTIQEGKKYELTAELKTQTKGTFLGVIKVYTDLDVHPLIDIPFIGVGI